MIHVDPLDKDSLAVWQFRCLGCQIQPNQPCESQTLWRILAKSYAHSIMCPIPEQKFGIWRMKPAKELWVFTIIAHSDHFWSLFLIIIIIIIYYYYYYMQHAHSYYNASTSRLRARHRYYSYVFQVCFWDCEVTFDFSLRFASGDQIPLTSFDCILQVLGVLVTLVTYVIPWPLKFLVSLRGGGRETCSYLCCSRC